MRSGARFVSSATTACFVGRWAASCVRLAVCRSIAVRRGTSSARSVGEFEAHDDFLLIVAPEGTRSAATSGATFEVRDPVGNFLAGADQVTLVKDLTVKGAGQTLKR